MGSLLGPYLGAQTPFIRLDTLLTFCAGKLTFNNYGTGLSNVRDVPYILSMVSYQIDLQPVLRLPCSSEWPRGQ
jgi:hypothetical protein